MKSAVGLRRDDQAVETHLATFKVVSQQEIDKSTAAFKEGIEKQQQQALSTLKSEGDKPQQEYNKLSSKLPEYEQIRRLAKTLKK
jgi:hypothetical protein